ncbi:MAG: acetyl-CoA C-acetyltransferase [Candidatus Methanoplasma sp.]|nr:acetyl-CoA C-acetyltransferase [Candidatus Methanoplasma sp.]
MEEIVILSAARTAIGKYGKALSGIKVTELGATAIGEAVKRAKLAPADIEECIMGNVISTGLGQNPARQSAVGAGLPMEIGSYTVNDVCGSGLKAAMNAADAIKAGEYNVIVAGGMESMSNIPYYVDGARWGFKMNDQIMTDTMVHDGLWDAFNDYHMIQTADNICADPRYALTREELDDFALQSQLKAEKAQNSGAFDKEIVPVSVKQKKNVIIFDKDENPRAGSTIEGLTKLRPINQDGFVTAGNASSINDGAAAVVVMSEEKAKELGVTPMATWIAGALTGVDPAVMGIGPVAATKKVMAKTGMKINDFDIIEANEAFAAQALAVGRDLGIDMDKQLNPGGGAIALGHPVGASGCRILVTLLHAMEAKDAKTGLATLCIGGGMGVAAVVSRD